MQYLDISITMKRSLSEYISNYINMYINVKFPPAHVGTMTILEPLSTEKKSIKSSMPS